MVSGGVGAVVRPGLPSWPPLFSLKIGKKTETKPFTSRIMTSRFQIDLSNLPVLVLN